MDEPQAAAGAPSEASEAFESLPREIAQMVTIGLIAALRALPGCDSFSISVCTQEDGSIRVGRVIGDELTRYLISAKDVVAAQKSLDAGSEKSAGAEQMARVIGGAAVPDAPTSE